MDLHRVEKHPDWASVPASEHNGWQKIAVTTNGIITIGNFFSLLGIVSVPIGLVYIVNNQHYILGTLILIAGRICDLLDGWLADKTGTKSSLGEKVDATIDKVSTGITVFVLAAANIVAWWAVVPLALPHIIIAILALIVFKKGQVMHPSRAGKYSMAVAWLSILTLTIMPGFSGTLGTVTTIMAYVFIAVSAGMGIISTIGYIREFRGIMQSV